ncbi:hypothetical protein DFH06DRAFT_578681 [Mycena polygramma]|nr:hypothetical protein DFH06DRAFT_578681 [Mycena polygramma]
MVEFPQELIDAILDHVAATEWYERPDYRTLKACALAARTFLAPSQRLLFHSLTLPQAQGIDMFDNWQSTGDMKQFAAGLADASHIASYVHDLKIDGYSPDPDTDTAMGTVLSLLVRLNRLVISYKREWGPASGDLRTGLNSLLALPSLRCIGFINCRDVPVSLVSQIMSASQEVAMVDTDFEQNDTSLEFVSRGAASRPTMARPLTRLSLAYSESEPRTNLVDTFMKRECALGSFKQLQHLEMSVRRRGFLRGLEEMLKHVDSIQHLGINLDKYHDDAIDLPFIPGLRSLTLQVSVRKLRVPETLMSAMATLPERTPNVEIVTVIIDAEFEKYVDEWHRPDTDAALKRLHRLREVRFAVYTRDKRLRFDVTKKLPLANEAGLLSFRLHNTHNSREYHPMRYFSN